MQRNHAPNLAPRFPFSQDDVTSALSDLKKAKLLKRRYCFLAGNAAEFRHSEPRMSSAKTGQSRESETLPSRALSPHEGLPQLRQCLALGSTYQSPDKAQPKGHPLDE